MAPEIIGRDEELGAVRAFVSRVGDGPGALVLSGEAGIGKTILWEAGVEEARARFSRVLTCRGVEAEASFAFAGLSELLAGVVGEVALELVSPRRHALEVALQLAEPGDTAPDAHVIGLALLDALQALADHGGPVLVAVDDAQWLDPASASVMQIAFRRLREERIGLLATIRLGPEVESALELEPLLPGRAAGAALARPAHARRAASFARGAARARADPTRARPRAGGDGRQSLLRTRAGARTRAHEHEAVAGTGLARSRQPARAARRPSRPPAYPHRRRLAPGRGACPAHGRARHGSVWRPRASAGGAGGGGSRRHRPARRLARSLRASLCSPRCLMGRRRSGNAVPCIARSRTW